MHNKGILNKKELLIIFYLAVIVYIANFAQEYAQTIAIFLIGIPAIYFILKEIFKFWHTENKVDSGSKKLIFDILPYLILAVVAYLAGFTIFSKKADIETIAVIILLLVIVYFLRRQAIKK